MFRLDGRYAIVTGGAQGIGAAIAAAFCEAGAHVLIADVDEVAARRQAERLVAAGHQAEGCALDVREAASWGALVARLDAEGIAVDILVNNAGVGGVGTVLEAAEEDLARQFAVNVDGPFHGTRAVLPGMRARRRGNIINMASVGGVVGIRDRAVYCMSKFAVVGLTKSVAVDYAAEGIRCNCICPGRVETEFVQGLLRQYPDPEAAYRAMSETQLLGRMGRPEEIAAAAVYLAAEESAFVTGSTFLIEGGWTAGR